MTTHPEIRAGLIGCGNIGAGAHAPAYAHVPDVCLVAVCDQVLERATAVAAETGADACQDYRQLLARDDIDMVDLCVPTAQHAPLAIGALKAGKHVLCEKPMARSLTEADAMVAVAQQTGLKLMIGHVRRFDHRYTAIKAAIDAGDIGQPVYIRRAERQWLPFPADAWFWSTKLGGGVILDIGVHIADLLRWYFGQNPPPFTPLAAGRERLLARLIATITPSSPTTFLATRLVWARPVGPILPILAAGSTPALTW